MSEIVKNIYGRIINKHDTEENWKISGFSPNKAETIIYDRLDSTGKEVYPYTRIKIGDGATEAGDLPFVGGSTLPDVGQGCAAKYTFKTPGWKRILNVIRISGGVVNFGIAQSYPLYMSQAAGICFSGFVKYMNDNTLNTKPVLYQMYNNIFGSDKGMKTPVKITAVRVGYPHPDQAEYNNGTSGDARVNPINCYLDVLVEFDTSVLSGKTISFNMNYSGFSSSHNCIPILEETAATDVGIYGEKLLYQTLYLDEASDIYDPSGILDAGDVKIDGISVPTIKTFADAVYPMISVEGQDLLSGSQIAESNEFVEGYPLTVEQTFDAGTTSLTMRHTGKNILPSKVPKSGGVIGEVEDYGDGSYFIKVDNTSSNTNITNTSSKWFDIGKFTLPVGKYTFSIGTAESLKIWGQLLKCDSEGNPLASAPFVTQVGYKAVTGDVVSKTFDITEETIVLARILVYDNAKGSRIICPQIEHGETKTDYETYQPVKTYTVDLTDYTSGTYNYNWYTGIIRDSQSKEYKVKGNKILAFKGTNVIYSNQSTVDSYMQVSGRRYKDINTEINNIPKIYSGTSEPSSDLGKVGDIYVQYSN